MSEPSERGAKKPAQKVTWPSPEKLQQLLEMPMEMPLAMLLGEVFVFLGLTHIFAKHHRPGQYLHRAGKALLQRREKCNKVRAGSWIFPPAASLLANLEKFGNFQRWTNA